MFATQNGGGFLTEWFPDAYKVIWDFRGQTATSRHIPGVAFARIVHPGLMGTAPSPDLAIFMPGTTDPQFSRWLAFSGTSVTLGTGPPRCGSSW